MATKTYYLESGNALLRTADDSPNIKLCVGSKIVIDADNYSTAGCGEWTEAKVEADTKNRKVATLAKGYAKLVKFTPTDTIDFATGGKITVESHINIEPGSVLVMSEDSNLLAAIGKWTVNGAAIEKPIEEKPATGARRVAVGAGK